ncbi:hypothetical protein [Bacillus velezensis]|uniref:hypothetical protein n=1 Tax=Bacillus velezensis TaxID=492670 RepID=UPI002FBED092
MSDRKLTEDKFDNRLTKFAPFISPNPVTSFNPVQRYLKIDKTSFISLFSSVKGDASLSSAKCAIRAIGSNTNLQEGVILHDLLKQFVSVKDKAYSMQGQISFGKSQISLRDPQREEMKAVHRIFVGKLQEGSKVSRAAD